MIGRAVTAKATAFDALLATVTTTLPVVAVFGTVQESEEADHVEHVAATPLKVTVLEPWDAPKVVPDMATWLPVIPLVGDTVRM